MCDKTRATRQPAPAASACARCTWQQPSLRCCDGQGDDTTECDMFIATTGAATRHPAAQGALIARAASMG